MSNVELERTPNKKAYMALRRQQGFKPFDKGHPLAQAIMKGWKEKSPADSLIISPELELMGRLPVNERARRDTAQHYLVFLQESLAGKLSGLREDTTESQSTDWDTLLESGAIVVEDLNVVLTGEKPKHEILSIFRTPEADSQRYTVVEIDTTAFKNGGALTIDIWVGDAEVPGSFDLFAVNGQSATQLVPNDALASVRNILPNESGIIKYPFDRGQVFKLGAMGNSSGKGTLNGFLATISVDPTSEKMDEH